jgi:hypothetical protein
MAGIFDYLEWRGDLEFSQAPINPVDYVIFSQLSYLPFEDIIPNPDEKDGIPMDLALKILNEKIIEENPKPLLMFKEDPDFVKALLASPRFSKCYLFGYVNRIDFDKEVQFAALCAYTESKQCLVIFRGTDSSFAGWKEDFNMAFREVIPSQLEAVDYLNKMGSRIKGSIRICGHSKGGNLAIYAASYCEKNIQSRIKEIYANDAPGFNKNVISSEEFFAIKDRIRAFVPQTSVVGMLMEHGSDYKVIKSSEAGLLQHLLFSWEVSHNDLIYLEKVTSGSQFVDRTLREWLETVDNEQREKAINTIYQVMKASGIKTLHELEKTWFTSMGKILKSLRSIDEATRKQIYNNIRELFRLAGKNLDTLWNQKDNE